MQGDDVEGRQVVARQELGKAVVDEVSLGARDLRQGLTVGRVRWIKSAPQNSALFEVAAMLTVTPWP